jgi:hypothetical protein
MIAVKVLIVVNPYAYIFDSEAFSTKKCLQDLNFNAFQGPGAVGADDLTAEPGIDQVRNPADVGWGHLG